MYGAQANEFSEGDARSDVPRCRVQCSEGCQVSGVTQGAFPSGLQVLQLTVP